MLQPPEQEIPCSPWRGPQWSSLKEAAGNGEHMQTLGWTCSPDSRRSVRSCCLSVTHVQAIFLKDNSLVIHSHIGAVLEDLQPRKDPH